MNAHIRNTVRSLAAEYMERGDPLGWFEELYIRANRDIATIPWADQQPNPNLLSWFSRHPEDLFRDARVLVVGCGLGDDANWFAQTATVCAFDISPSAIQWCQERYPQSPIKFEVADILHPQEAWRGKFDWVFEAYTLQVLPPDFRRAALKKMAACLKPHTGRLLVITRGRDEQDPLGQMPWPLTKRELFDTNLGMILEGMIEDYLDNETPPVRRFRATYRSAGF